MNEQIEEAIQRNIQSVVQDSQNSILNRLDSLISSKLSNFEVSFAERQQVLNETQLAKIESVTSSSYTFKRKGNEEQFKHSVKVMDKLKEATSILSSERIDSKVAAQVKINEGMELIQHRQKLIKLADSSKFGWKVVENYETHQLAANSDDEKRINKAESKCEKQVKEAREERLRKNRLSRRWTPMNTTAPVNTERSINQPIHVIGARNTSQSNLGTKPGVCFGCGVPGHWRKECPDKVQTHKMSTSLDYACFANSPNDQCDNNICIQDENVHCSKVSVYVSSPVGRLRRNVSEWIKIGVHEYIISVILEGYKLPFYEIPDSVILKNNKSALDNPLIVEFEIEKLLAKGCVSEVSSVPTVVNPLTVSFNRSGKPRLVLDCRHINLFLFKFKFRLEDASVARYMFSQGNFVFSFDLSSAYHHIMIFEPHRRFLGFSWNYKGKVKYYIFNVLAFGISTAAYIFTKVTRSLVSYWREQGLKVIMYLDDGLGGAFNYIEALKASELVRNDLIKFGFLIAEEKSSWLPSQSIIWLGCNWNFANATVSISDDRIQKLVTSLEHMIGCISQGNVTISARSLACVSGQILSMQTGIGKIVRFRTRYMFYCLQTRASWDSPVLIDSNVLDELVFWKENVRDINGLPFSKVELDATLEVYSDASHTGYGGYIVDKRGSAVIGSWSEQESSQSSTWRELVSVNRVMNSISSCLEGQTIKWYTDNQNVKHILEVGSKKRNLQNIALDINSKCESINATMAMKWIPRQQNVYSDFLSRCNDSDDWQIKSEIFTQLDVAWGPHTIDRFATDYNRKCIRFNSRWWCPGTEAVDAFSVSWSHDDNWLVPPPRLICKVISKLFSDKAKSTLVVPKWKSAPYWPLLSSDNNVYSKNIKFCQNLPFDSTQSGRGKNGIFGKPLNFYMVAFRFEF